MAVLVRRVDLVTYDEQWATSRVANRIYKFHSGQLITHGWISDGLLTATAAHFIVIKFQRQHVIIGN